MNADRDKIDIEVTAWDLVNLALRLEQKGAEFYRMVAEDMEDSVLRQFFLRLMGMELEHEIKVRELLSHVEPDESTKRGFDEDMTMREFFIQIRNLGLQKIFPDGFDFLDELASFKAPEDAFPLAMRIEENALALYQILSRFDLTEAAMKMVERLMRDEEEHFAEVSRIYRRFLKG